MSLHSYQGDQGDKEPSPVSLFQQSKKVFSADICAADVLCVQNVLRQLLFCLLHFYDLLFYRSLYDQLINRYDLLLSDPVGPVCGLVLNRPDSTRDHNG